MWLKILQYFVDQMQWPWSNIVLSMWKFYCHCDFAWISNNVFAMREWIFSIREPLCTAGVNLIHLKVRSHCVRPFWYQYPFQYPCQFPCPSQRSHSSVLFWWTISFLVSFLYFGRQNACLQLFRSTWKILLAAGVRQYKAFSQILSKDLMILCYVTCWFWSVWWVNLQSM